MRLTCPNCGAQYEVPDDVIPEEGRDVQCSNCGSTWFQGRDESPEGEEKPPRSAAAAAKPFDDTDDESDDWGTSPDPTTDVLDNEAEGEQDDTEALSRPDDSPEPDLNDEFASQEDTPEQRGLSSPELSEDTQAELSPDEEQEGDQEDEGSVEVSPAQTEKSPPQQRGLDPSLTEILREEAERETALRAAALSQGLETQPDLGLDDLPEDENARRSRQARDRMARIRGEDPRRLAAEATGLRRGILPDIEEINSTLRAGDSPAPQSPSEDVPSQPRKSGFMRGFVLTILAALILFMVYTNAPKIAQEFPQADPYLSSFVTAVDQARIWLDTQISAFQAAPAQ